MHNFDEKMLLILVEKYRKSKKDSGTGRVNRRTQIKPTELYKSYNRNDADMELINAVNETAKKHQESGFVTFEMNGFSNEISAIYLVDEMVEEAEQYLAQNYHYESKHEKMRKVEGMIARYEGRSPAADYECAKLRESLNKNAVPKHYEQAEDILKALVFIEQNKEPLYIREASMMIYGSSKYLEDNTLEAVCGLIRKVKGRPCEDDELLDEILGDYQIVREKQQICLKGDITVVRDGKKLEVGVLGSGITFDADELSGIEKIVVHARRFMTVENKTSYMRCREEDTAFFYLGGYANRFQREFLKKIYEDNPGLDYLHFGDIDAGGFYIHENLCRITGIPFGLYRMSVKELQDMRFRDCLLPLSENDRRRLKGLRESETYRDVVSYMLAHGVKLEQEIVSYYC